MASRREKQTGKAKATPSRSRDARSRRSAATASAPPATAPKASRTATETLHTGGLAGDCIRPSHWRYLQAKLTIIERGGAPTGVAVAKELGIHRVTLCKFRRRYPWLDAWMDDQAREAAVRLRGQIMYRHGMLAIQGSVQSADIFCKMDGGYYSRHSLSDSGDLDPELPSGPRVVVTNNILVPRPDYGPALALPPASATGGVAAVPTSKIPVVRIR